MNHKVEEASKNQLKTYLLVEIILDCLVIDNPAKRTSTTYTTNAEDVEEIWNKYNNYFVFRGRVYKICNQNTMKPILSVMKVFTRAKLVRASQQPDHHLGPGICSSPPVYSVNQGDRLRLLHLDENVLTTVSCTDVSVLIILGVDSEEALHHFACIGLSCCI